MNYCKPDYDNCLVNLSNSILKAFGAGTTAPTLKMADKLLEGSHKKCRCFAHGCNGYIDPRKAPSA